MKNSNSALALSAEVLRDRYEELRQYVTEKSAVCRGFGLVLFLREGMAAWMHMCAEAASISPPLLKSDTSVSPALFGDIRAEAAGILVTMALQGSPGGRG
jgi:hypothetical protein